MLFIFAPLVASELRVYVERVTFCLLVAGFFFVAYPMRLPWTHPPVTGPLGPLFGALHHLNNDYNCAPSLHIALLCCLWPVYVRGPLMAAWFVLGWLSTLLCWQHMLLDVVTGQLLGWTALRLFRTDSSSPTPPAEAEAAEAG